VGFGPKCHAQILSIRDNRAKEDGTRDYWIIFEKIFNEKQ